MSNKQIDVGNGYRIVFEEARAAASFMKDGDASDKLRVSLHGLKALIVEILADARTRRIYRMGWNSFLRKRFRADTLRKYQARRRSCERQHMERYGPPPARQFSLPASRLSPALVTAGYSIATVGLRQYAIQLIDAKQPLTWSRLVDLAVIIARDPDFGLSCMAYAMPYLRTAAEREALEKNLPPANSEAAAGHAAEELAIVEELLDEGSRKLDEREKQLEAVAQQLLDERLRLEALARKLSAEQWEQEKPEQTKKEAPETRSSEASTSAANRKSRRRGRKKRRGY